MGGTEVVKGEDGGWISGAAGMAETLRLAVANLTLPHAYSPIADHVTVSAGMPPARSSRINRPRMF